MSESIKAEVYTYLAGVAPYRQADNATQLTEKLRASEATAKDVRREAISVRPRVRGLPPVHDVTSYTNERIRRQIDDYYLPKSDEVKRRAYQFRAEEIALATVAALVSATESVHLGRNRRGGISAIRHARTGIRVHS